VVTRSDLIAELAASNPHLRRADIELIVTTIFDQITAALAHGGRAELRGFGAFTVKRRNPRIGRNPLTGEKVSVPEKAMPFFKAGKELRVRVNRGGIKPSRAGRSRATADPSRNCATSGWLQQICGARRGANQINRLSG
jgi:integration host factor subunit beta